MDRRRFISSSIAAGLLPASVASLLPGTNALAAGFPPLSQRLLVNVMMFGGPNFRHLMPPAYDPDPNSFAWQYWNANSTTHQIDRTDAAFAERWGNHYSPVNDGTTQFGILNKCGWLKQMWDAGNVAIVCNSTGGTDRNHQHCLLQMEFGDLAVGVNENNRSGWGGRLAAAGGGNVVSLTKAPRFFCYGPDPTNPLSYDNRNLLAVPDTRDMSLFRAPAAYPLMSSESIMDRALTSYYAAKRQEIDPNSLYAKFVAHEQSVRTFGDSVNARLGSLEIPGAIADLRTGALNDPYLGHQIRNLYDSFLASDLLNMRVASLELGTFDSHKDQKDLIEPMFEDLFGTDKAFDTLFQALPENVLNNVVFVFAGEFGRQIRANADDGTDHGDGSSILLVGNGVRGGVYGDMFPADEVTRLDQLSPDIQGLTSFEHIFGAACDWVVPGSGGLVFPGRATAPMETDLGLQNLFI